MRALKRAWPLLVIATVLACAYAFGVRQELSWSAFAAHEAVLRAFVGAHPLQAAAAYVAVYVVSVAVSIPGSVWLTITGGFLFGTLIGGTLAVLAAGCGAILLFLAARSATGDLFAKRAGFLLDRVRPGLERDGFSYLLALRLLPIVPFWLNNLAPALVGMKLAPYAGATFLGIAPATFVFASVGAGIGDVIRSGATPDLRILFSPGVLLPLLGLALISLVPVFVRHRRVAGA